MLKALEGQQYGFETPRSFQTCLANHRIANLSLSVHSKVEPFHTAGIVALDLEKVDERYLLSGSKVGNVCIYDLQNSTDNMAYTVKPVHGLPSTSRSCHEYSISAVQWYPHDTGMFSTSGKDRKLKLWDTNVMKPVEVYHMYKNINDHHMSPIATQHTLIALATDYPNAVLLDPRSGSSCHELKTSNHGKKPLYSVRWSSACEFILATGGQDSKIHLWDIRTCKGHLSCLDQHNGEARGNSKDLITAHDGAITSMCFTDDGLYLVSFGTDNKVRLWDVALSSNTLVNYGSIKNISHGEPRKIDICCNTNPPVIFVPSLNHIHVLELFSGNKILKLVGHFRFVYCCVYRPSTNHLYSGANDKSILIWTPDSKQENLEQAERKDNAKTSYSDESDWSDTNDAIS